MFKKCLNYIVLVFTLSLSLMPLNLYSFFSTLKKWVKNPINRSTSVVDLPSDVWGVIVTSQKDPKEFVLLYQCLVRLNKSAKNGCYTCQHPVLFREAYFKKLQKSNPKNFEKFPFFVRKEKITTLKDKKNYCLFLAAQIKDYNAIQKLRYCTSKYCLKLALYHAIENQDIDCIKLLLDPSVKNKPNIMDGAYAGESFLYTAIEKNNVEMVKILLLSFEGKIKFFERGSEWHPLCLAAYNEFLNIFKLLLPYSPEKAIHSAFGMAARNGKAKIISYLFNTGWFIPTSRELNGALLYATNSGRYSTVEILLNKGNDIEFEFLNKVLHIAKKRMSEGDSPKIYNLLLEYKKNKYPNKS